MLGFDGTTTEGISPPAERWEDRGNFYIDPITGSQVAKPITYCKDITRCGIRDYRSVSASASFNYLDECTPKLNGVISLSGLFFNNATTDQFAELLNAVIANSLPYQAGLQAAAAVACPVVTTP